jgi:hypothetical protein
MCYFKEIRACAEFIDALCDLDKQLPEGARVKHSTLAVGSIQSLDDRIVAINHKCSWAC